MTFTFPAAVAWDPIGKQAVKNSSFQAFAMSDTGFTTPLTITDSQGNPLPGNILNSGTLGVFPEFQNATNATLRITDPTRSYTWTVNAVMEDAAIANFIQNAGSATSGALSATYVPKWKPTTAYTLGQQVTSPNGDTVAAIAAHTSGTTFNPANWSYSPAFVAKKERIRPLGVTNQLVSTGTHLGFPYAVTAPDGNMVVAWRDGANHAPSKGVIRVARYSQGGTVLTAVATAYSDSTYDARDPGMCVLADGRIALTFFVWDQVNQVPLLDGCRVIFSSDNGVTWGSPVTIDSAFTTWSASAAAIVQLSNGNLLLSTYGSSAGTLYQWANVSRSTDNGATWSHLAVIANGDTDGRHYQEPNIILTDKGDLLAVIRSDTALAHFTSRSTDGGATWSAPVQAFPGSGSPRLTKQAGYIHAVHRHESTGAAVKISSGDYGVTWGSQIVLPTFSDKVSSAYGVAMPYGKDSLRYIYSLQTAGANNVATADILQVDSIVPEDRGAPGPITCRVKNTATVPINTATWTTVTFSAEDHDTAGMHSVTTNTSRISAPVAGYYWIKGTIYFAASSPVQVQARILKNGVTTQPTGLRDKKNPVAGQDSLVTASGTLYLNAGDYLEMQGYQDSGGTISIRWEDTVFELTMLSAPV